MSSPNLALLDLVPISAHDSVFMPLQRPTSHSLRYDLADVARQGLQNIFAETFASIQQKCQGWDSNTFAIEQSQTTEDNYTEHDHANCGGVCLAADTSGNCDRMPGCGAT